MRQKTTYRIRYWHKGRVRHTQRTYGNKGDADRDLVSFRNKHPSLKSRVVKQTVVVYRD